MSRKSNTRRIRAEQLLERVSKGPQYSYDVFGMPKDQKELEKDYKRWAESWIIDELKDLIPELRNGDK